MEIYLIVIGRTATGYSAHCPDVLGCATVGKTVEEVFDGFAAFEIVDQVLKRDARANKNGRSTHDLGIGVNDAFQIFNLQFRRSSILNPQSSIPAIFNP